MEIGGLMNLLKVGGQMSLAEVVQALVAFFGFWFVCYQILHLGKSIRGVTQDSLYTHYTEVGNWFLQKPYLRPYFYNDKIFEPDLGNAYLRDEIALMSEAILSLIEHAVLQRANLPKDSWERCWRQYARDRLEKSTETRRFFEANKEWYADALRDMVASLIEEIENSEQKKPSRPSALGHGQPVEISL
jgi:hypothetical protein